jgi:hypothetical protein
MANIYIIKIMLMYKSRVLGVLKNNKKEENKRSRLKFCLSMLEGTPHDPLFKSMHNIIHIDEKWFSMTKKSEKYYLLLDEEEPYRSCKSKNLSAKLCS